MQGFRSILIACAATLAAAIAHAEPVYKVIAIPLLPDATSGEAVAVNNKGVAVGRCLIDGNYFGFQYDALTGLTTPLGLLGPRETHGIWGINDEGWMVGTAQSASDAFDHAILLAPSGSRIDITRTSSVAGPAGSAQARAINTLGSVAGINTFSCSLTQSTDYGSRWSPGGFFVTPLLGSNFECSPSAAFAINDAGTLAGRAQMNAGSLTDPILVDRPFICDDNGQIPLPTFSSPLETGVALSIGTQGDVCGNVQDLQDSGHIHPALWIGGDIVKLHSLSGYLEGSSAFGVNAAVDVVGRSGDELTGEAVVWFSADDNPLALASLSEPAPHAPGYRLAAALAISDGGFIVGRGVGIDPTDNSANAVPFMLLPCEPVVIQRPLPQTSCYLGTPTFTVKAVGAGPLQYHWRRNGVELVNGQQASGSFIRGADQKTMTIDLFGFSDEGDYDVVISGSCGTKSTVPANTHVCRADLSCDGIVTDSDFPIFVVAYEILDCADSAMSQGCPADFNSDGIVDDADFGLFVQAYSALFCP
ncbi:MAG: hypothetical protein ACREJD_14630 [Phycisphaerales bacterium]